MNNLFNQSKPAGEYPKDWYVIPTMEVIEMLRDIRKEFVSHIAGSEKFYDDNPENFITFLDNLTNQSQQSILETPNKKQNVDSHHIVTEGDGNSSTMGTHANRPDDVKNEVKDV